MALSLYLGVPGSGKSYGVMKYVILPELRKGPDKSRHIFTNVYGLKLDVLSALVGWDVSSKLHPVTNQEVESPYFFPSESFPPADWVVQPGSLVVLDEANRFLASGEKVAKHVTSFVSEHRHYVGEDKTATDIVLVTQAYGDLNRTISKRTETTYAVTKLTHVDRKDEFRVDFFAGYANPERARPFRTEIEHFDPEIYKTYESYNGGVGFEAEVDSRGSFWDQRVFGGVFGRFVPLTYRQGKSAGIVVFVLLLGYLLYFAYSMYAHPESLFKGVTKAEDKKPSAQANNKDTGKPAAAPAPAAAATPAASLDSGDSPDLRLVGLYRFNGLPMAVMATSDGRLRYAHDFTLVSAGPASHIVYRGRVVSYWTGSVPSQQKQTVTK